MSYENRMESAAPRDERIVTVRRGFCHVFGGETYRYGYLTTPESPEYLANKAAWVLAPASLIERGDEPAPAPSPLIERGDEPAPAPSPVPAPDSGGDEDLPDDAVDDGVEDGED